MNRRAVLLGLEVLVPVAALAIWFVASAGSSSFYYPPLAEILGRFAEVWFGEGFVRDALPSLGRMSVGFAIAAVVGVVVGIALGLSRLARTLLGPAVEYLRASLRCS